MRACKAFQHVAGVGNALADCKKLKIMLLSPPQQNSYGEWKAPKQLHLGLAYLASAVCEEDVSILDMEADEVSLEQFQNNLQRGQYELIGVSVVTPTVTAALELAHIIRSKSPETTVVCGGVHPTVMPEDFLKTGNVDLVVRGEGEITFREIVSILNRGSKDFSSVSGVAFTRDGQVIVTPDRSLIADLDALNFPARDLLHCKSYSFPDALYKSAFPIITSRGCPGLCNYCMSHKVHSRKFRARSAANVVDEMELLVNDYMAKEIHIWDDNFVTDKSRVFAIRDEIIRRNIKVKLAFPHGIRADFLDAEILSALKAMGTYSISIGVESGCQRVLDKTGKGIDLKRIESSIKIARDIGLEVWAFFILGLPGENADSIRETIEFAKRTDPDIAKFHILTPFPGSEVYDYFQQRDMILTQDYSQYSFHTRPVHSLDEMGASDLLRWQRVAYRSFFFRPKKILQHVLRIKTCYRLILNLKIGWGMIRMILGK